MGITSYLEMFSNVIAQKNRGGIVNIRPKEDGSNRPWNTSVLFSSLHGHHLPPQAPPKDSQSCRNESFFNFYPHGDSPCSFLRAVVNHFSVIKIPMILFSLLPL